MFYVGMLRGVDIRDEDEEVEYVIVVFVKYNCLFYGEKKVIWYIKCDKFIIKFLKKYIYYVKSRIMFVFIEEVCCININLRN